MPRAEGREGRAGLASFGPHAPARAGSRAPTPNGGRAAPRPPRPRAWRRLARGVPSPPRPAPWVPRPRLRLEGLRGFASRRQRNAGLQDPCPAAGGRPAAGGGEHPWRVERGRNTRAQGFRERVYAVVSRIPRGRVLTYGDVAELAGRPRAAREVGWIAHRGPSHLPWQRVVNRHGGLASGYEGGRQAHRRALERDGVQVRPDGTVDLSRYRWTPLELVRWRAPSKGRRARSGGRGRWPSLR
jgi:methylated-DNA-protein-cysteine methyltransferase-like protein